MCKVVDVREFGAIGDGVADDTAPIQNALFHNSSTVTIPDGDYRITRTLRVPSHRHVAASEHARLFLCGETPKRRGDFLLTNADHDGGNEEIAITGGIWDGNNTGRCNTKAADLFDPEAWSGSTLNFFNVKKLRLENMELANSVVYNIRMCRLEDFVIRNIGFSSRQFGFNQDGLHFAGFVKNGVIEEIRALTKGQTNDDLLALNADDSVVRLENLDLVCGPIENLSFKNIYAQDCHTAIRLLSIDSPIRNIRIEHITAGCRHFAINMDAARYCRTPLFRDEDRPDGVGHIENMQIDDMTVYSTADTEKALICCESNLRNFKIRNFRRDSARESGKKRVPTLVAMNTGALKVQAKRNGETVFDIAMAGKKAAISFDEPFDELELN